MLNGFLLVLPAFLHEVKRQSRAVLNTHISLSSFGSNQKQISQSLTKPGEQGAKDD